MSTPKIGILMGSKSDADLMGEAARILEEFGVPHEMKVLSAHRTPQETSEYAQSAESRGIQALIAGGGICCSPGGSAGRSLDSSHHWRTPGSFLSQGVGFSALHRADAQGNPCCLYGYR